MIETKDIHATKAIEDGKDADAMYDEVAAYANPILSCEDDAIERDLERCGAYGN